MDAIERSPLMLFVVTIKREVLVLAEDEDDAREIAETELLSLDPNDYAMDSVEESEEANTDPRVMKLIPHRGGGTHETRTVAQLIAAGEVDAEPWCETPCGDRNCEQCGDGE